MRKILQPLRFLTIQLLIFVFLAHMGMVYLIVRKRWPRTRWSNRILSHYCRFALWLLNVKVNPIGAENRDAQPSALYVGNHLSYLDVLVVSSQVPAGFVTSMEIHETFFLGLICKMAGCLFVERRNKANLLAEVADLTEGLRHGLNVAIFPEATSTNGEKILRFRRALYMAAIDSQSAVVPVCINYRFVGGQVINKVTRDSVFWYGDMSFAPHLWALTGSGGVLVDLHFLPPVQAALINDPTVLAQVTQTSVESVFTPVQ